MIITQPNQIITDSSKGTYDVVVIGMSVVECPTAHRFALEGAKILAPETGVDILDGTSKGNRETRT